ncbi:MAG: ComF family protein [Candidatus Omnitrophota bacterium]|jgi:ComF family protein
MHAISIIFIQNCTEKTRTESQPGSPGNESPVPVTHPIDIASCPMLESLMIRHLYPALLDLLFPPTCILCREALSPSSRQFQLCGNCQEQVIPNRPPFCKRCSCPVTADTGPLCLTCQRTTYHFDQAWACCPYNHSLKKLLHLFKYHQKTALRFFFANWMLAFLETYRISLAAFDFIVPVPLHPARLRERGYNQSALLAQELCRQEQHPLSINCLLRVRNTKSQTTLRQKERWTNIQSAFTIKYPFMFKHKNILIVDDLFTTGATTSEVALVLKQAGARHVAVLTLAIAIQPSTGSPA